MQDCIFCDVETTGLSFEKDRILELSMIASSHDNTGFVKLLNVYIDPGAHVVIPEASSKIHNITRATLKDNNARSFREHRDAILRILRNKKFVAHNAKFDVGMIDAEFRRIGCDERVGSTASAIIDTLYLARKAYPNSRNSLDALCERYEISNTHRQFHGAYLDCVLLGKVYERLTSVQTCMDFIDDEKNTRLFPDNMHTIVIEASTEEQADHEKYRADICP